MVFEKLKRMLAEQFDVDADDITMESDMEQDLGADSLDIVDLIMNIEDEFDVEIDDDDVERVKTVGDVVHYIEDRI